MGYQFKIQTYDEKKSKTENCELKPKTEKKSKKSKGD